MSVMGNCASEWIAVDELTACSDLVVLCMLARLSSGLRVHATMLPSPAVLD